MPALHRNDGFSDDGLSYSVAGDFNKLLGQAMSNYEARATNPQSFQESDADYKQRVASAPDILANELLPLGIVSPNLRGSVPRTYKDEVSNKILSIDPRSGHANVVYQGETKPPLEQRYSVPTGVDIFGKPTNVQKLTLDELGKIEPTLPDIIRTNSPITGLMGLRNNRTNAPTNLRSAPIRPGQRGTPAPAAIQHLLQNPGLADQFNQKYGDGAASQYLR